MIRTVIGYIGAMTAQQRTRVVRNIAAGVVATIAAVSSFSHMREVALTYGQTELLATLLPFSVDGMIVVATIAMVDDKAHGLKVRWSAWVAFIVGALASIAANIVAAPEDAIARVISAWPAVALLLVVEVLARGSKVVAVAEAVAEVAETVETVEQAEEARKRRAAAETLRLARDIETVEPGITAVRT